MLLLLNNFNFLQTVNCFFNQKFLLLLPLVFSFYWFLSIFIFLYKRSIYCTFTTVIQRFWKRTLMLFWGLELFLFGIYLFLAVNSSNEVEWLYDQPQLYMSFYPVFHVFFLKTSAIFLSILFLVYLQFSLIATSFSLKNVIFYLILFLLTPVFLDEFYQVFLLSSYYSNYIWSYGVSKGTWSFSDALIRRRTAEHYYFLIGVIKFWHIAFIYIYFILSLSMYVYSSNTFQGSLSSNRQNFIYLLLFSYLSYYGQFRGLMRYIYCHIYNWFYINTFDFKLLNFSSIILI